MSISNLQREAWMLAREGHMLVELVHVLQDGGEKSLSSPITHEDYVRGGYTSHYYTLLEVLRGEAQ